MHQSGIKCKRYTAFFIFIFKVHLYRCVSRSDLETFGSETKAFISTTTKPRQLINYTTARFTTPRVPTTVLQCTSDSAVKKKSGYNNIY